MKITASIEDIRAEMQRRIRDADGFAKAAGLGAQSEEVPIIENLSGAMPVGRLAQFQEPKAS